MITTADVKTELNRGAQIFIFVDDFLGTGAQFSDTISSEGVGSLFNQAYVTYAPLVGHVKGIRRLKQDFPDLRICPVETLDDTFGLFHQDSPAFADQTNTPEVAKAFYYELLDRKKISEPPRLGYGHLQLTYTFAHATPDNCLPIMYWRENGWQPLFEHRT